MVRRSLVFGAAALLLIAGARPAAAGAINFATGDVEKDMAGPNVLTIVNHPFPGGDPANPVSNPGAVYQAPSITNRGAINGWVIKDLRVYYDQPDDRLYVGVNFFGVAGDADGNGVVGTTDPSFSGREYAHLGYGSRSDSSITVGIDLLSSGQPTIVAGIAADKTIIGKGTDGFTVALAKDAASGLSRDYGLQLDAHNGNLAFEPSADHPDFEFSIAGLSQIPGFDIANGIGLTAFAGSSDDIDVGEDAVPYTKISLELVPEPATLMAWSLVAAGAAWRGVSLRRRNRGA